MLTTKLARWDAILVRLRDVKCPHTKTDYSIPGRRLINDRPTARPDPEINAENQVISNALRSHSSEPLYICPAFHSTTDY